MKTLLIRIAPALALALLTSATAANAQDKGACCVQSTSRLDALLNPVEGGDEKFFTSISTGLPNVIFSVDNSGSMLDWPFALCPGATYNNGCTCAPLNNLGYSPAVVYPKELDQINSSTDGFYPNWFNTDKFYEVRPRRGAGLFDSGGALATNYGDPPAKNNSPLGTLAFTSFNVAGAANDVCDGVGNEANCRACLPTKGYYFDANPTNDVMTGNFLNFFSPKYTMTRKVVKEVIRDIRTVRLNIQTFWKNGSSGFKQDGPPSLIQPWNPSCDKSSWANRQSFLSNFEKIKFWGGTPLTRSLMMAGYSYNNVDNPVFATSFGANWYLNLDWTPAILADFAEASNANGRSVCSACAFSAIILFTDGEPNDNCEDLECATGEHAGDTGSSTPPINVGPEIPVAGCAACGNSRLDEVARYLWNTDLRPEYSGKQSAATYTVAFALDPSSDGYKILQSTASVGGGEFYAAKTAAQLKEALFNIFESINSRNTAFSSANIASLQTGDTTLSAIIPRMRPQKNAPWGGLLYRFNQYNEFVLDTEHPDDGDLPDAGGYKNEVFLTDNSSGADIVIEDQTTGAFVKRKSPNTPAVPFWEANDRLANNVTHAGRDIFTVVDSNNDGLFANNDSRVSFTAANAATLLPYMGLAQPGLCPNAANGTAGSILAALAPTIQEYESICGGAFADGGFAGLGLTDGGLSVSQSDATLCCAKMVIEWTRGRRLGGLQSDGGSSTRAEVLGDIFHSSPITVDPPANRFLCDLGVSNQCIRTLYSTELGGTSPTPLATASVSNECGAVPGANAYDAYLLANYKREKLVVVGANDGMLHAFKAGTVTAATVPTSGVCPGNWPNVTYNAGTGDEAWAFVPPDQLSRLHERIFGHQYYVDGDTMVRDIWADQNNDGIKNDGEFHTIAIGAEGRGGTHYFALELKWSSGVAIRPEFRWLYPQPCTPEAQNFGKTLYSLSPKPPPIGPVLLGGDVTSSGTYPGDSTTSTPSVGTLSTTTARTQTRYGKASTEQWVVMLSGGWAPFLDKGRGLYMVDAWHAKVNSREDNLWWKAEYEPGATGNDAPRAAMTHSFAAPVAMVDYGQDFSPRLDGYFDTLIAGDTAGQLWVARMANPGTLASGLIANWPVARAFEQDRYATSSVAVTDPVATLTAKSTLNIYPFFYLPSAALQSDTGALRAFIGTGNRYAILDDGPGVCRFDNPLACSKYDGCATVREVGFFDKRNTNLTAIENHWSNTAGSGGFAHGKQTVGTSSSYDYCGTGGVVVNAGFTAREIVCAGSAAPTNTPAVPSSLGLAHVQCGKNGLDAGFYCGLVDGGTFFTGDFLIPDAGLSAGVGNNRFYGVKVYGGGRYLDMFNDGGIYDPPSFDDLRYTDRGGDAGARLVDVTATTCTTAGCTAAATSTSSGWFYEYPAQNRKTASGSVVLAGCVLWSDLFPSAASDGGCNSAISAKSDLLQADFITGAPNCAVGFLSGGADGGVFARSQVRDVVAPPPEPSMAIMIGPDQKIKYSAVLVEPGKGQATQVDIAAGNDVLQTVYELPVSRELHRCRHTDAGCM